jgi:hydroxymethylpyrimidine pyrophosphatase-like HAD family hydrolase
MSTFASKIDRLAETLTLRTEAEVRGLSAALADGLERRVVAIGSGGSAIAAEYLGVCRRSLTSAETRVQTPLEFVLGNDDLADADIWIFSASGANTDIIAAASALGTRDYRHAHVVSRESDSPLQDAIASFDRLTSHVVAAADPKDGFLATHSLAAAVHALLLASDALSPHPAGPMLVERFNLDVAALVNREAREGLAARLSSVSQEHTVFVLQDPRLTPMALLVETSAWEAALCAVQRTDLRNFAHGRHVWLGRREASSFVLALTGAETDPIWKDIRSALPDAIGSFEIQLGNCGRYQNAVGVIAGLCLVEAIGRATGIDPGQPGIASFSRQLFDSEELLKLERRLTARVRHKASVVSACDPPDANASDLAQVGATVQERLEAASFAAMVIDYDGTMITAEDREAPPSPAILAELERLIGEGLRLAIATGRGGSAGEMLRLCFPNRHDDILISYYNGALTRSLRDDISAMRPQSDASLDEVRRWLETASGMGVGPGYHDSGLQLTVFLNQLDDVQDFIARFEAEANALGKARMVRSGHTLDICSSVTCKTSVAHQLAEEAAVSIEGVLCIGDSGGWRGNDHRLLGLPSSVSVNRVCDRVDVCWSLFGVQLTGPAALLRILQALRKRKDGGHGLQMGLLEDSQAYGTKRERDRGQAGEQR